MSSTYYIPSVLLAIPRNPVTAVGLPLVLGVLSGAGTANAVRGQWYKVCNPTISRLVPDGLSRIYSFLLVALLARYFPSSGLLCTLAWDMPRISQSTLWT